MPFVIPTIEIMKAYSNLTAPIIDEIYNKQAQNIYLLEARDRLLPKIMSGEIEV